MQRDCIDFGKENVSKLFLKMFVPTLLGMVCSSLVNITDGIFVGRGVGSDALAAVNLCAPLFMIATGIALMLGAGGSVVVAIHLSRGNRKAANINMTQSMTTLLVLGVLLAAFPLVFQRLTFSLLGGTDLLVPYMHDYMRWIAPSMLMVAMVCAGMFFIRLDGNPTYAMLCEVAPTAQPTAHDKTDLFIASLFFDRNNAPPHTIKVWGGDNLCHVVDFTLFADTSGGRASAPEAG